LENVTACLQGNKTRQVVGSYVNRPRHIAQTWD
jgi:hypothetical protein